MNKIIKYFKHCRKCDSEVKLTCPDCLVGKETLISRGNIWAETFDGVTWQIHEIDPETLEMKTIGEIYFVDDIWAVRCLVPKQCIIAHGNTPAEALDSFIDLYNWQ